MRAAGPCAKSARDQNETVAGNERAMADTKTLPGVTYSPAMDEKTHEQTYRGFVHFVEIGSATVLCWVVALAVGGSRSANAVRVPGMSAAGHPTTASTSSDK